MLSKKEKKKILRKYIIGATGIPNNNYKEGSRQYQRVSREIDKKLEDDQLFNELERKRQSFIEFLRTNNLGPYPPLQEFLNRDMSSFIKPKKE